MSLISFIKEAGEKIFGKAVSEAQAKGDSAAANAAAAEAIVAHVQAAGLNATGLTANFDSASGTAKLYGIADDQATKEKIILTAGNVQGVASVQDHMTVVQAGPSAVYYAVVKGDTLSKIAKQFYGDANLYPKIFEANQPMLKHPDKIYPGQNLRIPPK
jgi:nucleoid-associated protein YgaU